MRAALFDSGNNPVKIIEGNVTQITANVPAGGFWREIPDYVELLRDVPAHNTLPVWPTRIINVLVKSDPLIPELVHTNDAGQVTFAAPTGLSVTTDDDVEHLESGGNLVVTFPGSGEQYVKVEEMGKSPISYFVRVMLLSDYKDQLKAQVDRERDRRLLLNITVGPTTLDGDATAQKNIAEAATLGAIETIRGNVSWTMNWITAANAVVSLTAAELEAFAGAISIRRGTEYAAARAAKDLIMAAANQTAADAELATYLSS